MPLLSIIIPVYNVEAFLNECLDSVLQQDLQDFEVICIDDGSTDNSGRILDKKASSDMRVRVVHQKNFGVSCARNVGLKLAKGKYIAFVDSDDIVRRNIYTHTLRLMQDYGLDALIFSFETFPDGTSYSTGFTTNQVIDYHQLFSSNEYIQTRNSLCFAWRFIFKRSVLMENGLLFDEQIRIGEDMIFCIDAICHSTRIMAIDIPLYLYRKDNINSLMTRCFKPELVDSYTRMFNIKQEQIARYNLSEHSSYVFDLFRYSIKAYLPLMITNIYQSPGAKSYNEEVKRIYALSMFRQAFRYIGFRNIGLNKKEYVFYLVQKFRIMPLILHYYNKRFGKTI